MTDEIKTCSDCPCRNEDVCLIAARKNGLEFWKKLKRRINKNRRNANLTCRSEA